ncbi:MAG: 2Fe-2S iron-sulfur cluster-binding protein, partial [Candidatus Thorarchaeota archaeon]
MTKTIKTSVLRYNPDSDDQPYLQDFDVEYEPGMTVLDVLLYIQDKF